MSDDNEASDINGDQVSDTNDEQVSDTNGDLVILAGAGIRLY